VSPIGLTSLTSPIRIRRERANGRQGLPIASPVNVLVQFRSAECAGCTECVAVGRRKITLIPTRRVVPVWAIGGGAVGICPAFGLLPSSPAAGIHPSRTRHFANSSRMRGSSRIPG